MTLAKYNIDEKLQLSLKKDRTKKDKPKKIERNKGIRIKDTGIKNLKLSSNFKELDIQYKFEKK